MTFDPYLSMNDYVGLAHALMAGAGIGELPPILQPQLISDERLVEVMPKWRFEALNLSVVHLGNRYLARPGKGSGEMGDHLPFFLCLEN